MPGLIEAIEAIGRIGRNRTPESFPLPPGQSFWIDQLFILTSRRNYFSMSPSKSQGVLTINPVNESPHLLSHWEIAQYSRGGQRGQTLMDSRENFLRSKLSGEIGTGLRFVATPKWCHGYDGRQGQQIYSLDVYCDYKNERGEEKQLWWEQEGSKNSLIIHRMAGIWGNDARYTLSDDQVWTEGELVISGVAGPVIPGNDSSPCYLAEAVYNPSGIREMRHVLFYIPNTPNEALVVENPEEAFAQTEPALSFAAKCPEQIDLPRTLQNLFSTQITEPSVFKLLVPRE